MLDLKVVARPKSSVPGAISRSASRRKQAAAAAHDRVEYLLTQSPGVIYSFQAYGDYAPTFVSRNLKDLLGYEREEISRQS